MIYPHQMPESIQQASSKAAVVLGPTQGYARAPFWLAIARPRAAEDIEGLSADADAIQDIFDNCPISQWGAAAQASMA